MFEVRHMRFDFSQARGQFVVHTEAVSRLIQM
jgi:hypothetical protein